VLPPQVLQTPGRTAAERLLAAAARGEPCDFMGPVWSANPATWEQWGPERQIDARLLHALCVGGGEDPPVHPRGVHLIGAKIVGALDFESATLRVPLILERCFIGEPFTLEKARAPHLRLNGCFCRSPLNARELTTTTSLELSQVRAMAGVSLVGASVGSRLDCQGATFEKASAGSEDVALAARGLRVGGDVSLRLVTSRGGVDLDLARISGDLDCSGATFESPRPAGSIGAVAFSARRSDISGDVVLLGTTTRGQVSLVGANIGGNLGCAASKLHNQPMREGAAPGVAVVPALDAEGIKVGGYVSLRSGFRAEGGVSLMGGQVGLSLGCTDAECHDPGGLALNAQGLRVSGDVYLRDGFSAIGEVLLFGADIGGSLDCHRASFVNEEAHKQNLEGNFAIRAHTLKVRGTVLLHAGCVVKGEVNFTGAVIGGDLDCRGARFGNPKVRRTAFSIESAQVGETFYWGPFLDASPTGRVDFRRARVGRLVDDPKAWSSEQKLELNGFEYQLLGDAGSVASSSQRLSWLRQHSKGEYFPQPFEQLAAVYDRMGDEADARRVRIEKQRMLRLSGRLRGTRWLSNLLLDWTVRYGWEPWRALVLGLVVVLLGALLFGALGEANFERTPGSSPSGSFHPVVYSLDTFLPIIDLGQESRWTPRETVELPRIGTLSGLPVQVYLWLHTILGWGVSTVVVAAYTGLVRKT
jgi:hypothetical protein